MTYLPPPFELREGEKQVLVVREWLSTYDFSRRHFFLVTGPFKGQNFRHDIIPWAKHIMDMWDRPEVREIIICGTSQVAKTSIAYDCLLANQYRSPAPAGLGMPDRENLKRVMDEKIARHILASSELRRMLSDGETVNKGQVRFKGSTIYGMYSHSEASMSSVTMRDLGLDEEDAYAPYAVQTMMERQISYGDEAKTMRYSKPRGSEKNSSIWRGLKHDAQVIYQVRARCPIELCGHRQVMTDKNIVVPRLCKSCGWQGFPDAETCPHCDGRMETISDPQRILVQDLARYRCEKCGALWNDHMRDLAVRGGDMHAEREIERPTKVGYHFPSWVSPFVKLSKVMSDWFKAYNSGDPKLLRKYDNDHKAMPYKVQAVQTDADVLRKMVRPDCEAMVVPEGVLALTCGIDMQMAGFWFTVRGWMRTRESFLIQYGWLDAWQDVEELLFNTTFPHVSRTNVRYPIWRAGIDIGGGETEIEGWSKTDEVKNWLVTLPSRGFPDNVVTGIKGASRTQQLTVRASRMQLNPLDAAAGQDKIGLYTLDTNDLKDTIFSARIGEDARQPMWLHKDTDERYFTQMTAEERVEKENGTVAWRAKSANNHLLDCEVYAAACAHADWMPALVTLDQPYWNVVTPKVEVPVAQGQPKAFNGRMKRLGRINPNAR